MRAWPTKISVVITSFSFYGNHRIGHHTKNVVWNVFVPNGQKRAVLRSVSGITFTALEFSISELSHKSWLMLTETVESCNQLNNHSGEQ